MTVRTHCLTAALAALLSLAVPPAFALDEIGEQFGNDPLPGGRDLPFPLLAILNDPHRVYLYHIHSDGYKSFMAGYFQGDTPAANAALSRFAALEKGLEVVLLPGPRQVFSYGGKQKVSADWELHIPITGGLGDSRPPDGKPTLYLYVRVPDRPAVPATAAQVARWLALLDAEEFDDRERASAELEKQGAAVIHALRQALQGQPSAEARRRIGLLLGKLEGMPGVNLGVLTIPEGVRVLGPDDLMARNRKGLKSDNVRAQWEVADLMARFGPDPAALATLTQMLADKSEYLRYHAADALAHLGKAATPALPALRAALAAASPAVRTAIQNAIKAIEADKDETDPARRAEQVKAAREEISRFVKGRQEKTKE
jgi:hypothetical protein